MGIGAEPAPLGLAPEVVELVLAEPALQEGARVDAGGGVALVEDLVTGVAVVLAPEEVIEPHLVEGCRRGVGGEVAADAVVLLVGPGHHDRRVPADDPPDPALHLLVTGKPRFLLGGDGVDVVGLDHRRDADLEMLGVGKHLADDIPCPARALGGDQVVERLEPLTRLLGVDVGKLLEEGVEGHLSSLRGKLTIVPPQSLLELGFPGGRADPGLRRGPGAPPRGLGAAPDWHRSRPRAPVPPGPFSPPCGAARPPIRRRRCSLRCRYGPAG